MPAILTRPTVRDPWAATAAGGSIVDPDVGQAGYVSAGWPFSQQPPPRQYWNWVLNYCMNGVRYNTRRGVAEWSATETYTVGDHALFLGGSGSGFSANTLVRSIVTNNINNIPGASNNAAWQLANFEYSSPALIAALIATRSLTIPGHSIGADGLIKQWGIATVNDGNDGGSPVFFHEPFPHATLNVMTTSYGQTSGITSVISFSLVGATLANSVGATGQVMWTALGW